MKISIPKAALRRVRDSEYIHIRIEDAADCDGSECGRAVHDTEGQLEQLPPHFHIIALGRVPDAGPRCYAIRRELPEDVYESAHWD